MGYTTKENWISLFEGKLRQLSMEKTEKAERWVELLKHPQNGNSNVRLSLVIYRCRRGQKAEKKEEHAINGDTVLGLEKGVVEPLHDSFNRYIALIMKSQSLLFQMNEMTCSTLYNIFQSALRHASWRIHGLKSQQAGDQALHLTSHYLSISKVKTLRLHRCWPLTNICNVSYQGNTTSFTILRADAVAEFQQFILKNEDIATKCKAEVEARWSKMSEKEINVYCSGPGEPGSSASHRNDEFLSKSNNGLPENLNSHAIPINPLNSTDESRQHSSSEGISINNPTYGLQSEIQCAIGFAPNQNPHNRCKKKPALPSASKQCSLDHVKCGEPRSLQPFPKPVEGTAPPVPTRISREFTKSVSMEEGRDRWDKFVSVLGVEEDIKKSRGKPDKYSKRNLVGKGAPANQITRIDRASIVPQRPSPKPRTCEGQHQGEIENTEFSYSLYTFLFQVWNSREITADTLGMKLRTWNDFVVYFELLSGDVKDWKFFAERIGMTHMDIQVIDNYGIRFNQCATAIVMLFWQQNSQNLKEEYSRPVLLKILRELEREDLIEVVTGSTET